MKKVFVSIALVVLIGLGCSGKNSNNEIELTDIDTSIGLVARVPKEWESAKFNTLYKNPKNQTGFSYVQGAVNYGFGVPKEKGELAVKVHVIAVPKSQAPAYEKAPFLQAVERRFETPDYVVYTAIAGDAINDPDVGLLIQTLTQKK